MLEYSMDELSEQLTESKATYAALVAESLKNPDDTALAICVKSLDNHIKDLVQELRVGENNAISVGRKHEQLVAV